MSPDTPGKLTRRTFLGGLVGAGTVSGLLGACSGGRDRAPRTEPDPRAESDRAAIAHTFDLHAHPGGFYQRALPGYAGDDGFAARIDDMLAAGMTAGFFSLVADMSILERTDTGIQPTRAFEPGEAWRDYRRQLGDLRALMADATLRATTDLSEADAARREGMAAAFIAVEGGDFLEGDVGRLERTYADGVRSIQLVHYAQNDLGDLQTEPPVYGGLSPFGLDVVDGMVELGMVIDVAHASFDTVAAVADRAGVPVVLSHSLLDTPERPHPRHITEDHARLVAGTGGVIGLWPSGFGSESLDEFVDHTFRMVEVVGVDHVGLGTDMDGNYRPVIAGYADYRAWVRALAERGLSETDIGKLAGVNARRVLGSVL